MNVNASLFLPPAWAMRARVITAAMAGCAAVGAMAKDTPATPSPRQRLAWLAYSNFDSPSWEPVVFGHVGLIYDNRDEPREIELEALEKRAAENPQDDACRRRMAELLENAGNIKESAARLKEAQDICRQRLAAAPEDACTMAWLAIDLRNIVEGEELAKRAVQAGPQRWETWLALAQTQAERVKKMCFEGLSNLPKSGVDLNRLAEGLKRQAASQERSQAIFDLVNAVQANSLRAMELAPAGETEPYLRHLATHLAMGILSRNLHLFRREPVPAMADEDKATLDLMQKGVTICRDRPEALALLGLLTFQNVLINAPRLADGKPDPKVLEPRETELLGPFMNRLRELCDHHDAAIAAPACEAYAGLVNFVEIMGGHLATSSDLPALVAKATQLAPQRCLAWELRISLAVTSNTSDLPEGRKQAHALALERLKMLPTARSHALAAHFGFEEEDEILQWRKAIEMEPRNIEFRLNLAAALLRHDAGEKELAECLQELQTATQIGYENRTWERNAKLDRFRRKTFILHQALSGNVRSAREAVTSLLQQYPGDTEAASIQRALEQLP